MPDIFALIDCNNFYVSCEKLFAPSLENKAVVVLSNNDGCIIARSQEAKQLGIKMGVPIFEISQVISSNNVFVFSTNYSLYGDISQRVMGVISKLVPDFEIYSIDEAFVKLPVDNEADAIAFGAKIKDEINNFTGIPVTVGIGMTKTLAKVANQIAKSKPKFSGVLSLINEKNTNNLLMCFDPKDIWGVGEKYYSFFKKSCNIKISL